MELSGWRPGQTCVKLGTRRKRHQGKSPSGAPCSHSCTLHRPHIHARTQTPGRPCVLCCAAQGRRTGRVHLPPASRLPASPPALCFLQAGPPKGVFLLQCNHHHHRFLSSASRDKLARSLARSLSLLGTHKISDVTCSTVGLSRRGIHPKVNRISPPGSIRSALACSPPVRSSSRSGPTLFLNRVSTAPRATDTARRYMHACIQAEVRVSCARGKGGRGRLHLRQLPRSPSTCLSDRHMSGHLSVSCDHHDGRA